MLGRAGGRDWSTLNLCRMLTSHRRSPFWPICPDLGYWLAVHWALDPLSFYTSWPCFSLHLARQTDTLLSSGSPPTHLHTMPDTDRKDIPQDVAVREGDRDRDRDRSSKTKGSAKSESACSCGLSDESHPSVSAKDLSHVPCKFFKVGSCTAGSSCPFSHTILEPGQQKEMCAWFVKGNCKFGHKCALAHVLPGQSMSMDRKNKKAAQAAASAAANAGGSSGREKRQRGPGSHLQNPSMNSRNPLLSGSTAPTRNSRTNIPMPLKATLSPSAPAPPVQNTDFASFGLPDESNKLPNAPAQGRLSSEPSSSEIPESQRSQPSSPRDSTPSIDNQTRPDSRTDAPKVLDLGVVGSPPRSFHGGPRVSGVSDLSPGTSPHQPALSSSPFSAPSGKTLFAIQDHKRITDFKTRSGLSASLGTMLTWSAESSAHASRGGNGYHGMDEPVVEDGELEEFIPGSLTDLLTPEERSRRFSRNNATRPAMLTERDSHGREGSVDGSQHRHSRSVPAPSLLQDIRAIWTDESHANGGPDTSAGSIGGLGNGTPSSFQSNSGFGGRSEDPLAPSNASAAFLPGLHHFMSTKTTQHAYLPSGMVFVLLTRLNTNHHVSRRHGHAQWCGSIPSSVQHLRCRIRVRWTVVRHVLCPSSQRTCDTDNSGRIRG